VNSDPLDRMPPHDLAAERGVLGSIVLDSRMADEVASVVTADDFHAEAHRKLYGHVLAMAADGVGIDSTTLVSRLKTAGDLEAIGGVSYLAEVLHAVPIAAHAVYYARIVARHAKKRRVIHAACEILQEAYSDASEAEDLVVAAEAELAKVQTGDFRGEPVPIADAVTAALDRAQTIFDRKGYAGLLTGFPSFDEEIGGLFPGELFILAARPGVGKTALACQVAQHVAGAGKLVYFVSLEMSAVELTTRLLCSQSGVSSRRIRTASLTQADCSQLVEAGATLSGAKMLLHERPAMAAADIRRTARRLASKGLSLIVVDYLQRVTPEKRKGDRKRYEEVGAIVESLKTLARELNLPVLCLCQSGRGADEEDPDLKDLRESGDIEQAADVVAFLVRNIQWRDYNSPQEKGRWPKDKDRQESKARLRLRKNRNGPLGSYELKWFAEATRFQERDDLPGRMHAAYDEFQWFSGRDRAAGEV